ncbi:MAG TPA: extracellular solute-binding protein [Actinopolymorphaceae bacterium]|jgi:multiple sugar transport system substrate-binding protein
MWRKPLGALAAVALLVAAGCGDDNDGGTSSNEPITMWTVYDTADRMATMEGVLDEFTAKTGIKVKLVGVSAPDLPQAMVSAAAAGDLPDVVVHGNELAAGWVKEGILDPAAATEVVEKLNPATFSESALNQIRTDEGDGEYATVPSDGWGQMIFYRKDLYEQENLDPPTTYDAILAAAKALNKDGVSGFALGNAGGNPFTAQVFEHFALANDCHLVDDEGNITLNTPNCVEAIQFYMDLNEYAPAGAGDVDTTRANYLAGKVGTMSWSPHLLDELAGLFPDTPPTCEQCKEDPTWLADRTAMVPLVQGPSGDKPTQYGITINLGITTAADVERSQKLVEYLLSDGYMGFLSISPEGRYPMRSGPKPGDTSYEAGWAKLAVGSGTNTATTGELYGEETLDTIAKAATSFESWGIAQGSGELVTALRGDLELTRILREALDGNLTAQEAAEQMQQAAEQVQAELS